MPYLILLLALTSRKATFALLFLTLLCTRGPAQDYKLDEPELLTALPAALEEISGLAISNGQLLAVQDERGEYHRIDLRTGDMGEAIGFWKDGDYEGIEVVGDEVWVLKSTGTLYRIVGERVEKYNTWLTGENDAEGLGYDPSENRLLIACKDDARDDGRDKDNRYVFAFDLDTKTLDREAVYTIPTEENDDFAPSALAIHPLSGKVYMMSSVNNLLMVIDRQGQIERVHKFDRDLLPQPEGIAFTADGTLYLSTEARGDRPARIYKLPLRP